MCYAAFQFACEKWRQKGACPRLHMVRTAKMTDVMLRRLRRSGRIKAGLEERVLNRFHIFSRKDCRCNDKKMLQSNRTVPEQDLSFWPGSSPMEFCIPWAVTSCVSEIHVDTTGIIWDRGKISGPWRNFRQVGEVQNAFIVLRTNGYGRYQEPNPLDQGHVKPC